MITNDIKADIFEALENMNKWAPVYKSLLKVCKTREDAIEALKYLMEIDGDESH